MRETLEIKGNGQHGLMGCCLSTSSAKLTLDEGKFPPLGLPSGEFPPSRIGDEDDATSYLRTQGWMNLTKWLGVWDWNIAWRIEQRSMTPRFQIGSDKYSIFHILRKSLVGFIPNHESKKVFFLTERVHRELALSGWPTYLSRRGSFPWRPRTPRWPRAPCRSAI